MRHPGRARTHNPCCRLPSRRGGLDRVRLLRRGGPCGRDQTACQRLPRVRHPRTLLRGPCRPGQALLHGQGHDGHRAHHRCEDRRKGGRREGHHPHGALRGGQQEVAVQGGGEDGVLGGGRGAAVTLLHAVQGVRPQGSGRMLRHTGRQGADPGRNQRGYGQGCGRHRACRGYDRGRCGQGRVRSGGTQGPVRGGAR